MDMPEQKPAKPAQRKICVAEGYYSSTANTQSLMLIYSLKNRKFIRGRFSIAHNSSGKIWYMLYEGRYLIFDYDACWERDPRHRIVVELHEIRCDVEDARFELLARATIEFNNLEWLMRQHDIPEPVKDFATWLPGYHSRPVANFNKIYSETEHIKLLELVLTERHIREGEKNE
jgi:hypothetical protein